MQLGNQRKALPIPRRDFAFLIIIVFRLAFVGIVIIFGYDSETV